MAAAGQEPTLSPDLLNSLAASVEKLTLVVEQSTRERSTSRNRPPRGKRGGTRRGYNHKANWANSQAPKGGNNNYPAQQAAPPAAYDNNSRGRAAQPQQRQQVAAAPKVAAALTYAAVAGAPISVGPGAAGVVPPPLTGPLVEPEQVAVARGHRPASAAAASQLDGTCYTSWMWQETANGRVYRCETHIYDTGAYNATDGPWDRTILYNPCTPEAPAALVRAHVTPSEHVRGVWGKGGRTYVESEVKLQGEMWQRLVPYPTSGLQEPPNQLDPAPEGLVERPVAKASSPWRVRFQAPTMLLTAALLFWAVAKGARAENAVITINGTSHNSTSVIPGHWRSGGWGCATVHLKNHALRGLRHSHVCHTDHGDQWCTRLSDSATHDANCTSAHATACSATNYTCGPIRPHLRGDRRCGRSICGRLAREPAPVTTMECTGRWGVPPWYLCATRIDPSDHWACNGVPMHPGDCCESPMSHAGSASCAPLHWAYRRAVGELPEVPGMMGAMLLLMPWMLIMAVCSRFRRRKSTLVAAAALVLSQHAQLGRADEASAQLCSSVGCSAILLSPLTILGARYVSQEVDGGCFTSWDLEATGACICDVPTDVSCSGLAPHVPQKACNRIWNATQRACQMWVVNPYASGGWAQLGGYFAGDGAAYKAYHPTQCAVSAAFDHTSDACWGFPTDTTESVFLVAGYVQHPNKTVHVVFHRELDVVYTISYGGQNYNVSSRDPVARTPQGVLELRLPPLETELTAYTFSLGGRNVTRWGVGTPNCAGPDWASPVCARHSPDCTRDVGQPPEVPTLRLFDEPDQSWAGSPPPGHVWARPVKGTQARKCGLDIRVGPYGHAAVEMPEWLHAHTATSPVYPAGPILARLRTPRAAAAPPGRAVPMSVRVEGCYSCGTPADITGAIRGPGSCPLAINGQHVAGLAPGTFSLRALLTGPPPYTASCGAEEAPATSAVFSPAEQAFRGVVYGTHTESVHETAETWAEWARAHWWQLLVGTLVGLLVLFVVARAARCLYHLRGAIAPATPSV